MSIRTKITTIGGLVAVLMGCEDALRSGSQQREQDAGREAAGGEAGRDISLEFPSPEYGDAESEQEPNGIPAYSCTPRPEVPIGCEAPRMERYLPGTNSCSDLSQYPGCFVNRDGGFRGYFVIGEAAPAADNISMTVIASSMLYLENGELKPVHLDNRTQLDSEVTDINSQYFIAVGLPCVSNFSAELLGYPADCTSCLQPGEGRIQLFNLFPEGHAVMLVDGYSSEDLRRTAEVIANRADELCGLELRVTGTTWEDAVIGVIR